MVVRESGEVEMEESSLAHQLCVEDSGRAADAPITCQAVATCSTSERDEETGIRCPALCREQEQWACGWQRRILIQQGSDFMFGDRQDIIVLDAEKEEDNGRPTVTKPTILGNLTRPRHRRGTMRSESLIRRNEFHSVIRHYSQVRLY